VKTPGTSHTCRCKTPPSTLPGHFSPIPCLARWSRREHLSKDPPTHKAHQNTNKQLQKQKTQQIEELSHELDRKKQLEDDLFQAQNALKVRQGELKELMDELNTLRRIQAKKDKLIQALESGRMDGPIRQLEGDKRYLISEIAKHTQAKRQQERTIRTNNTRIEQLSLKLEGILDAVKSYRIDKTIPTDAVAEAIPSADGTIDVDSFDALLKEIAVTRHDMETKERVLQNRDVEIETLERKVEILNHAHRSEARVVVSERRELNTKVEQLRKKLDAQQSNQRKEASTLRKENATLRNRVLKTANS